MKLNLQKFSGIHPGIILDRELKKRKLAKGRFALSIQEFPQTITAITKGRRRMNTALALKIEDTLGLEEGYFMILQLYYDIALLKKEQKKTHPLAAKLRPVLFWDTDMQQIDWEKQKAAIIRRVFERGNEREKKEILAYYGKKAVDNILKSYAR